MAQKSFGNSVFHHSGVTLEIPNYLISERSGLIRAGLIEGWYEADEVAQVISVLQQGDVVLELGGGIGFASAKISQQPLVKRVIAVEADPRLVEVIRRTHALNDVDVETVNAVVAQNDGEAVLYLHDEFGRSSILPIPNGHPVRLRAIALSTLLEQVQPSILLVDLEGAELSIFEDLAFPKVRAIVLEFHPDLIGWSGVARAFAALSAAGFSCAYSSLSKTNVVTLTRTDSTVSLDDAEKATEFF